MTVDIDRAKRRIAKLVAHAKSAEAISSQQEADAFTAKAQAMLAEHGLSWDDIDSGSEGNGRTAHMVQFLRKSERKTRLPYMLACMIAEYFFCTCLAGAKGTLLIVGRSDAVDVFSAVLENLMKAARKLSIALYPARQEKQELQQGQFLQQYARLLNVKFITYKEQRKDYINGFLLGVHKALSERKQVDLDSSSCRALCLMQTEIEANSAFINDNVNTSQANGRPLNLDGEIMDPAAFHAGVKEGQQQDV